MRQTTRHLAFALLPTMMVLAACGEPTLEDTRNQGPVYAAFEAAAIETEVPIEVLLALGWVESRWEMVVPDAEHSPGPSRWGIMGLAEGGSLDASAEMVGLPVGELQSDLNANIRSAAALLSVYAEESMGPDFAQETHPSAWVDVLARYSGFPDADLALEYAEEIVAIALAGAGETLISGEIIELEGIPGAPVEDEETYGQDENDPYGNAQQNLATDSPHAATFRSAHSTNYSRGRSARIDRIIVHTVQGSYAGCISWFQNPKANVSAHYVVRSSDGQITQMVRESDTGWHVRSANSRSIGIEHEGWVTKPSYYTEAMYRSSGRLVCDIARRHGIPLDRTHVRAHSEMPGNDHTDPGRHWDWNKFMSYARQACGKSDGSTGGSTGGGSTGGSTGGSSGGTVSPGAALLQGVIYRAPNTGSRIGGATVRVAGKTVTTNSNGYYRVSVPAGTHSITASASGYAAASISRRATSGAENWGSIGLSKAQASAGTTTGTAHLVGVVYASPNSSRRLGGAAVTLSNGKTVRANTSGYFSVAVPPGTYTVSAYYPGYSRASVTRKVTAGQKVWGSVGLSRTGAKSVLRGVVYQSPDTRARIGGATVRLSNGAVATADGSGAFSFSVDPGTYRISASASGYTPSTIVRSTTASQETWGSVALRPAGQGTGSLIGVIFEAPDTTKRVAGAAVRTSTGQSVIANERGVYILQGVPSGEVSIFASAPGFLGGRSVRTVMAGQQVWGSVGLIRTTTHGDAAPIPVSPIGGAAATANPTFVWKNVPAGALQSEFSYHVVIASPDHAGVEHEFVVEGVEDGESSHTFELTLPPGTWMWNVSVIFDTENPVMGGGNLETFVVP